MNHRQIEALTFEEYSFTELDRRCDALGVTCDGAAWQGFLIDIRKNRGVLEAIGAQLRRAGPTHTLENQFSLLECWYNVARLYVVKGGLDDSESCSPDAFVSLLARLVFDG